MRTKREILEFRDKDGIPKYWRGSHGDNILIDEKDVLKAMDEYASELEIEKNKNKQLAIDYINKISDLLKMGDDINVVARLIHVKNMIKNI